MRKTWWDCVKEDMKNSDLSQEHAQCRKKLEKESQEGNRLTQVDLEKWPLKCSVGL